MKIILPAVLLLVTTSSFAKNYADQPQPFTPQTVQDVLHCKVSSLDFSFWIPENFTGYLDPNERAGENVGRFVNEIDNITYRYRLPFKVHLANPLDGKEVEGQYVAIRNNAVYLEIDWTRYPKLHSLYRQKYQENLQELTQQLKGQNSTSKTTPKKLDTLGYDVPAVEKSITDPNKKLKIWKYFGFAAAFKADVLRSDSDKGYIGCRYPL
jgi:putative peptidoglycan bound protein